MEIIKLIFESAMRVYRPLSLPANLIDLNASSEYVSSEVVLDSSADSVDSAGFFRRFADHMRAATGSRDAVYCKGVTDYSFSQSPTVDHNPTSSVNRSILVQAGFDPGDSGDECTTEVGKNDPDPKLLIATRVNRPSSTQVHSVLSVSASGSVTTTPSISVSTTTARKRWSDFGTRLVGFVDKILLPEVEKTPASALLPSSRQSPGRSGSDERLCSLSAAHAIGRRSASRCLSNQSDASDVIQMYSDIGRLQRGTVQEDETRNTAAAMDPLQNKQCSASKQSSDSVLRYECYISLSVADRRRPDTRAAEYAIRLFNCLQRSLKCDLNNHLSFLSPHLYLLMYSHLFFIFTYLIIYYAFGVSFIPITV